MYISIFLSSQSNLIASGMPSQMALPYAPCALLAEAASQVRVRTTESLSKEKPIRRSMTCTPLPNSWRLFSKTRFPLRSRISRWPPIIWPDVPKTAVQALTQMLSRQRETEPSTYLQKLLPRVQTPISHLTMRTRLR